jgi:hypothetical protein
MQLAEGAAPWSGTGAAKVDAAKADAAKLGRRLGEGKITLDQYDVIIAPLEARIARLTAQADALKDSGGSRPRGPRPSTRSPRSGTTPTPPPAAS